MANQSQEILADSPAAGGRVYYHPVQDGLVFLYQGDSHSLAIEVRGEQTLVAGGHCRVQFFPVNRVITQHLIEGGCLFRG